MAPVNLTEKLFKPSSNTRNSTLVLAFIITTFTADALSAGRGYGELLVPDH